MVEANLAIDGCEWPEVMKRMMEENGKMMGRSIFVLIVLDCVCEREISWSCMFIGQRKTVGWCWKLSPVGGSQWWKSRRWEGDDGQREGDSRRKAAVGRREMVVERRKEGRDHNES